MNKCECYVEKYGICTGTKECNPCSCGGDVNKCDFYPEMRKAIKTMNFAEAWIEAQSTGKYYINEANQIVYQKDIGLVEADDFTQQVEIDNFDYGIESIMRAEWVAMDIPVMTKEDAEKKFGIKIVG